MWREGRIDTPAPGLLLLLLASDEHGPIGGESPIDVQSRAVRLVKNILQQMKYENICVVTHGTVIKVLLSSFLGTGLQNMFSIAQHNTAVNVLNYDTETDTFEPVVINSIDHLPPEERTEFKVIL
jgi:broad specificity phosphatase PhoE